MTDNKTDFTLVKPGETKEEARAAIVALFEVMRGGSSTPEETRSGARTATHTGTFRQH